ncbi:MAG: hypothetical protein H7Z16_03905 [Pyrinomonadaceae bacterium]|nr:hypothetical protein [Pyrinomonadaceae bacterium]
MTTLEKIIEEVRKLPVEEQRRLRAALETLDSKREAPTAKEASRPRRESLHDSNGNEQVRRRRMEWLKSNREEYGGQYVALDGDQLVAVAPNYRVAREKALAAGKSNAFVTYLSKPDEIAEMGGWV